MTKPKLHPLQELFEGVDTDFGCRSYSGRGMYGETCLGISVDLRSLLSAVADALLFPPFPLDDGRRVVIVLALQRVQTDSMGCGSIVYFPGIPYTDPFAEDDEDICECGNRVDTRPVKERITITSSE